MRFPLFAVFLRHIIKMFNVKKITNNIIIIKQTSYKKIAKKWHRITWNDKIMIETTNAAPATQLGRRRRKISKSTVARAVAKRTKIQDMNAHTHREQRMRSWEFFFFIHRLVVLHTCQYNGIINALLCMLLLRITRYSTRCLFVCFCHYCYCCCFFLHFSS